jgi:hypothetical protein
MDFLLRILYSCCETMNSNFTDAPNKLGFLPYSVHLNNNQFPNTVVLIFSVDGVRNSRI